MRRREFLKNLLAVTVPAAGCGWWVGGGLRGAGAGEPPVRPPGAVAEAEFLARCIRCLRCAEACPNNAIVALDDSRGRDRAGTPAIQPRRQACMLCNKVPGDALRCTAMCPTGALQRIGKNPDEIRRRVKMGTAVLDKKLCYSYNDWTCGACYRACPLPGEAMSLGLWERPEVLAGGCVGCGLCERACIRYPRAIRVRTVAA
ncbi:MAG: hypothetical protein Kow0092_27160 [Deferrisomatales bacterium]